MAFEVFLREEEASLICFSNLSYYLVVVLQYPYPYSSLAIGFATSSITADLLQLT